MAAFLAMWQIYLIVWIKSRPARKLRIWIDFYETKITDAILNKLIEQMASLDNQMIKLAIVGLSFSKKIKLKRLIKKASLHFACPLSFFSDPEEAKTWLVS